MSFSPRKSIIHIIKKTICPSITSLGALISIYSSTLISIHGKCKKKCRQNEYGHYSNNNIYCPHICLISIFDFSKRIGNKLNYLKILDYEKYYQDYFCHFTAAARCFFNCWNQRRILAQYTFNAVGLYSRHCTRCLGDCQKRLTLFAKLLMWQLIMPQ